MYLTKYNLDLISKSKNWMTVFVGYGKMTEPLRDDEHYISVDSVIHVIPTT